MNDDGGTTHSPFQSQSHSYGGKNGSPPAVKYIPLPHHDLPVLIYQSVDKPPIHVVHTPAPATPYSPPKKQPYQGRRRPQSMNLLSPDTPRWSGPRLRELAHFFGHLRCWRCHITFSAILYQTKFYLKRSEF